MKAEHESSRMSFLHYFHAGISNHLSEKPHIIMSCFLWSLNRVLTVNLYDANLALLLYRDVPVMSFLVLIRAVQQQ